MNTGVVFSIGDVVNMALTLCVIALLIWGKKC
jgi:hypothetical protein